MNRRVYAAIGYSLGWWIECEFGFVPALMDMDDEFVPTMGGLGRWCV